MVLNSLEFFKDLWSSSDFSDVTIVSEDQEQYRGHRNIISAFSPVLKKLFKLDSQNPSLLYLNGINSAEIQAIMNYIYLNEIPETWTQQLQSVVSSLQIKGLMALGPKISLIDNISIQAPSIKINKEESEEVVLTDTIQDTNEYAIPPNVKNNLNGSDFMNVKITKVLKPALNRNSIVNHLEEGSCVAGKELELQSIQTSEKEILNEDSNNEELDESALIKDTNPESLRTRFNKSPIEKVNKEDEIVRVKLSDLVKIRPHNENELKVNKLKSKKRDFSCDLCNPVSKFLSFIHLRQHVMTCHEAPKHEETYYNCEFCTFRSHRKDSTKKHTQRKHLGIKDKKRDKKNYPCDQCDYIPTDLCNLRKHKRTMHEGVTYSCSFCEYSSRWDQIVKRHIRIKHEGKEEKYQCSQCGKQYTTTVALKAHVQHVHEGKTYKCDFCEYHATRKANLGVHFQKMHKD